MRSHSSLALLSTVFLALFAQPVVRADDVLNFFNNWFVTGDYAVAGTGLKTGSGIINMSGVPCTSGVGPSATIVPCTTPGSVPAYPVAAFLYWQTVESTSTATGANGVFDGSPITGSAIGSDSSSACWVRAPSQTLRVYRADVLRFLPVDPTTLLRLGNGAHTITLGSGVSGNSGILATEGASLVVIYRVVVPGKPLIVPFRSVVIHDGEFTLSARHPFMNENILGFYQASSTKPAATMTHIVGNGQAAFREILTAEGSIPAGVSFTEPFVGAQGNSWDNLTFGFNLPPNASSAQTTVSALSPGDCLSWGAVVTSTNVQDSDNDGLLDVWEVGGLHRNTQVSPATFGDCDDYPTEPCVDLRAMGAVNGVKDIFLQIDWMHGYGDGTGGINGSGLHSHMPQLGALTMVAKAFAGQHIAVHFDVGNNYQRLGLPYIIPYRAWDNDADDPVIAQGGSDIDESTLVCHDAGTHVCDYHEPYPVLSFKFGLASIRDGNSLLTPPIPSHFAQNRKDVFHYVLFAHALGGPYDLTGRALTKDPLSISGISDRPGADLMVTLGLWRSAIPANDQAGSVLVQAGTLMHELGHNLDLSHAGWSSTPNCKPNYPSVMSYLYQTRGLTDVNGVEQIDYSYGRLAGLNENSLSATAPLGSLQYRVRFYAPLNATDSPGQAAQVHCDGTPIVGGASEIRLEGSGLSTPDWSNATVKPLGTPFAFDVNYDGVPGEILADQPDWSSLNLAQIGSRVNFGSLSTGSAATDAGSAATDAGSAATDAGSAATDAGSAATDAGSAATDAGSAATDAGMDEDYTSHIMTSADPIPTAQQCTGCGLTAANGLSGITLSWIPPGTGGNLSYSIYRCAGAGCDPTTNAAANRISAGFVPADPLSPTFTDTVNYSGTTCSTCYNITYTYSVTDTPAGGGESPYSTDRPSSEITHLFVIADNQAVVYGSANPTPTFKVYGDVAGSLNNALVSCVYTPAVPRNAGNYPIACSGPATTSATDGVTYNAAYLTYTPGTLTISPRPITVTAAASSKTYDGTATSTAKPTIASGALAYSDTVTWTESYDNKNVGTTHVMTPAGTVSDGNGGNNYAVKFVTINTGVINKAPLTITAATNTKTYDGNTTAAAVPTVSGLQTGDSATGLAETYDNANAGTSKTLSVSSYTVNDGNSGGNYNVTTVTNTTGVINKANATVVVTPYTVTYDGNAHTATVTSITGVNGETGATVGTVTVSTTHTAAGTYSDSWSFAGAANYNNIASTAITDIINKATATVVVTPYSVTYDGNPHTATGTATGVKGESLAGLNVSSTTHTNAADYPSDPWTFTDTTSNYNNSNGVTHDSISPAPLTITADNKSVGDDSPLPPFTVTYHTLLGTDTPASLTGTLVCTTTWKRTSPPSLGNFPITCSGQSSTNYTIKYLPGTLNVFLN